MNTERVVSAVVLLIAIYGGVWAVIEKPSLVWLFAGLIVAGVFTVLTVWEAPVFDQAE